MTKQFELVYLEDGNVVAVDKKVKPYENEVHYSDRWKDIHGHHYRNNEDTCWKIIASVQRIDDSIPLMRLEEKSDLDELIRHCDILISSNEAIQEDWVKPFITGVRAVLGRIITMKAASKEKGYSEDDMEAALTMGLSISTMTNEPFTSNKFKILKDTSFSKLLKELQPKYKAVEIEVNSDGSPVIENGYVKIVNLIGL